MEFYFKKPSKEACEAMCGAVNHTSLKRELIKSAEKAVCELTSHKHSKIVNSGNSAILDVMSNFHGKVLVPDQGGWSGFIKISEFLGLEVVYLPTDLGLIDPHLLMDVLTKENPESLFLTSFAGYTAEQPLKEIYKVCDEEGVLLVEDASGALGDGERRLANGKHAHIIVASTGSPKIVNVGNGGFISTDQKEVLDTPLKFLGADHVTCAGISKEIKHAPHILSKTVFSCSYLKEELENVFHEDKRGVNVIFKVDNPNKFSKELRAAIKVHSGGMISKCPRYDRILKKGVALEIKNLDVRCLTPENLDGIIKTVNSIKNVEK